MSPRDLAVFFLAALEEYAEVALSAMDLDNTSDALIDELDRMLSEARDRASKFLGDIGSRTYDDGTPPVVALEKGSHFMRILRVPGEPTNFPDSEAFLARQNLEVVK